MTDKAELRALVEELRQDAEMLKDGWQRNLTKLWHSDVVREVAKDCDKAADALSTYLDAEGEAVAWRDESMAVHWIDRYAAGLDDEPQMDRILKCVAPAPAQVPDGLLDPDMPARELRLHMGEMTAQEERTARAAIRWANTRRSRTTGDGQ